MKEAKRARAPTLKIEVNATTDLIDKAIQRNSYNCFVAEAIKTAFPAAANVIVDLQAIRLTDPETRLRFLFFTPRVCQLALIAFDQGVRPEPFQFTLVKPMRITRGRGPANPEETPEQKIEKRRERQRKHDAAEKTFRAKRMDEPFAPPVEATHEVKKAMDDPYAPLGPPIALNTTNGGQTSVEAIVGGAPPRYRRGRNPGTNIIKQRRFGAHDLIE